MRETALILCRRAGRLFGMLCSILPYEDKILLTKTISVSIQKASGRISSLFFTFGYEMTKRMFRQEKVPVRLEKVFDGFRMELDVTQKTQRILYLQKEYEPNVAGYITANLSRGDTFVDIGANVGYYTLLGATLVGKRGQVIAFEPEAKNFRMLERNVALNGFRNVVIHKKAVGTESGKITLHLNPLNEGGHSIREFEHYHDDADVWSREAMLKRFPDMPLEQIVDVISLYDFLAQEHAETVPRIIKMDVEGAEINVLRGMENLLARPSAPDIIAEVSKDGNLILDLLKQNGYRPFTLDTNGIPTPYEYRSGVVKKKELLFTKENAKN